MDIKATLETRTNKKGKTYKCVVIKLTERSEKIVFLEPAELELLEVYNDKKDSLEMPDFR